MPEVPEVANMSQWLCENMRGKHLTNIKVLSGRYTRKPIEGLPALKKALPLKILDVSSIGKFLWFNLSERFDIWNTLGLTGYWSRDPKNARIELVIDKKKSFYYTDNRNFGTIKISKNKNDLIAKIRSLTPDFLRDPVNLRAITNYDKSLASLLMSQTKLGSGLGTYLVSEVLYRAKLSPHRLGSELTPKQIRALEYAIAYTTKLAYKDNPITVKKINYHPEIKLKDDVFEYQVYRRKKDPKGNPVKAEKIVGDRKTWWVPAVQK